MVWLGLCSQGRISSSRIAGSKLAFVDLFEDSRINSHRVQFICNYNNIAEADVGPATFKDFLGTLHRGDVYSTLSLFFDWSPSRLQIQA